jgi:hypothetical protein
MTMRIASGSHSCAVLRFNAASAKLTSASTDAVLALRWKPPPAGLLEYASVQQVTIRKASRARGR